MTCCRCSDAATRSGCLVSLCAIRRKVRLGGRDMLRAAAANTHTRSGASTTSTEGSADVP